jgi:hypothetical protein
MHWCHKVNGCVQLVEFMATPTSGKIMPPFSAELASTLCLLAITKAAADDF